MSRATEDTEGKGKMPPAADPSSSALHRARVNLSYLALGSSAAVAPASLTTRSFLTTTRYVLVPCRRGIWVKEADRKKKLTVLP